METIKIGLPCSPSTMLQEEFVETDVTTILVSYGGGMGGSSKTYYAATVDDAEDNMIRITNFDNLDEETLINKAFIVERHEKEKVVRVVTDTTAHSNYGGKNSDGNMYTTEYFVVNKNNKVSLDPRNYGGLRSELRGAKLIKKVSGNQKA